MLSCLLKTHKNRKFPWTQKFGPKSDALKHKRVKTTDAKLPFVQREKEKSRGRGQETNQFRISGFFSQQFHPVTLKEKASACFRQCENPNPSFLWGG